MLIRITDGSTEFGGMVDSIGVRYNLWRKYRMEKKRRRLRAGWQDIETKRGRDKKQNRAKKRRQKVEGLRRKMHIQTREKVTCRSRKKERKGIETINTPADGL